MTFSILSEKAATTAAKITAARSEYIKELSEISDICIKI